ncbi:hypothetical protein [Candidatus Hodarchaeum mangrovi]
MNVNLPGLIKEIISDIENLLNKMNFDRGLVKPVKIRRSHNNIIVTWNIFPSSTHIGIYTNLQEIISKNLFNINGEILSYNITEGLITDHTHHTFNEFLIHQGSNWDIYLYDPEIFIYIRLIIESNIKTVDKKWISLDIDVIEKSAWFLE